MPPAILKRLNPWCKAAVELGASWISRTWIGLPEHVSEWESQTLSLSLSRVIGRIEILGGPQEVITVAPHFQSSKHSKSAAKRSLSHIIRVLYRRLCRCWACWVNYCSTPTAVSGAVLLRHLRMVGTAGEDTHWVHELGVLSPVDNHRPAPVLSSAHVGKTMGFGGRVRESLWHSWTKTDKKIKKKHSSCNSRMNMFSMTQNSTTLTTWFIYKIPRYNMI